MEVYKGIGIYNCEDLSNDNNTNNEGNDNDEGNNYQNDVNNNTDKKEYIDNNKINSKFGNYARGHLNDLVKNKIIFNVPNEYNLKENNNNIDKERIFHRNNKMYPIGKKNCSNIIIYIVYRGNLV